MPAYTLPAGDSLSLKIPLLVDGAATSIEGWSVWLVVLQYKTQADAEALALLSLGAGIAAYDATSWIAELEPEHTEEARHLTYYYFIRGRSPAGRTSVLEEGTLTITAGRPAAALG